MAVRVLNPCARQIAQIFFSKSKNYFFETELFISLTLLSLPEALTGISDLERVPGEWRELPSLSSPLLFVSIINEITTMD